jgi:uncharacterized protein
VKALLLSLLMLGATAGDVKPRPDGAQPPPVVAIKSPAGALPELTGRVVDRAGILPRNVEAALTGRLAALEKATTDQLVVVTVPSLGGEPIKDFGVRLGNSWGIGRKGVDNGVLLIVAPAERWARIEVGRGLEGLLTDQRAQRIMDEQVVPACRRGRCDRAIVDGVEAIMAVLSSETERPRRKRGIA